MSDKDEARHDHADATSAVKGWIVLIAFVAAVLVGAYFMAP